MSAVPFPANPACYACRLVSDELEKARARGAKIYAGLAEKLHGSGSCTEGTSRLAAYQAEREACMLAARRIEPVLAHLYLHTRHAEYLADTLRFIADEIDQADDHDLLLRRAMDVDQARELVDA